MSKKLSEEKQKLRKEIREKVVGYVGAGLGLIASLAWNEAIKAGIESLFPLNQDTILAKFIYAGAMTLILVVVTTYLIKLFGANEDSDKK
jgi:hypothetical protein